MRKIFLILLVSVSALILNNCVENILPPDTTTVKLNVYTFQECDEVLIPLPSVQINVYDLENENNESNIINTGSIPIEGHRIFSIEIPVTGRNVQVCGIFTYDTNIDGEAVTVTDTVCQELILCIDDEVELIFDCVIQCLKIKRANEPISLYRECPAEILDDLTPIPFITKTTSYNILNPNPFPVIVSFNKYDYLPYINSVPYFTFNLDESIILDGRQDTTLRVTFNSPSSEVFCNIRPLDPLEFLFKVGIEVNMEFINTTYCSCTIIDSAFVEYITEPSVNMILMAYGQETNIIQKPDWEVYSIPQSGIKSVELDDGFVENNMTPPPNGNFWVTANNNSCANDIHNFPTFNIQGGQLYGPMNISGFNPNDFQNVEEMAIRTCSYMNTNPSRLQNSIQMNKSNVGSLYVFASGDTYSLIYITNVEDGSGYPLTCQSYISFKVLHPINCCLYEF